MASFQMKRGLEGDLPSNKTDGVIYFCTDTGNIFIDYITKDSDQNDVVKRKQINADQAQTALTLGDKTLVDIQGDFNTKLSGKADKSEIPTKLSDLINDSSFVLKKDVGDAIDIHNMSSEAHSTTYYNKTTIDDLLKNKADDHDHKYAGSDTEGGAAKSASKLTCGNVGTNKNPVYFEAGEPKALGYTIEKSVPSDAEFTDTKYVLEAATTTALGGIKSGGDITVDENGVVSVNDDSHDHVIGNIDTLSDVLDTKLPKSGGDLDNGAKIKLTQYGTRTLTLTGNSIDADMSADVGTWAGSFATVKDAVNETPTTMLGWYGNQTDGLHHIYMGGTYLDPHMKMEHNGQFTFKVAPKAYTSDSLLDTLAFSSKTLSKNNPAGDGTFSLNRKLSTTIGAKSFAAGDNTTARGVASHAVGYNTTAYGKYSHAEGYSTYAGEQSAHAEGEETNANGKYSHAEGYHTDAEADYQHVQGVYNIISTQDEIDEGTAPLHIVGNGTAYNERSNAHTLDWSGNAWFAGDIYTGGTGQYDENAINLNDELDKKADKKCGIYYIEGYVDETTYVWTGSHPDITEYYSGLTIAYTNVGGRNGSINNGAKLNINNLGEVDVIVNTGDKVTNSHTNYVFILVYTVDSNGLARWRRTDNNTDSKVMQSKTTSSTTYPLLLANASVSTASSSSGSTSAGVRLSTDIYAKPSTGTIYADNFSGLASKATKLDTPRSITADLTNTTVQTFDGTANVSIGVSGTLPISSGGTEATTAAGARTNLEVYSKDETDSAIANSAESHVKISGSAMTGALTLASDPTNALHAATKQYVDNGLSTKASVPNKTAITLLASSWPSSAPYSITLAITGILADEAAQMIWVTPSTASQSDWVSANIRATGQAENSITFTADKKPTANITGYVAWQNV